MRPTLVFKWNDAFQTFVFAEISHAIRTDKLHRAIFNCTTWEELKDSVHADEYEFVCYMYYDYNDEKAEVEPSGALNWDFLKRESCRSGYFPSYLLFSMADVIPAEVLEKHGSYEIYVDVFSYRRINPENLVPMIGSLIDRGFDVLPAINLIFDEPYQPF